MQVDASGGGSRQNPGLRTESPWRPPVSGLGDPPWCYSVFASLPSGEPQPFNLCDGRGQAGTENSGDLKATDCSTALHPLMLGSGQARY